MDGLRVLVVAGDPLARAGLAALLSGQPECTVVGQVPSQADLADQLAIYRPDVVLWDLGWDPAQISSLDEDRLIDLPQLQVPIVALLLDDRSVAEAWGAGVYGMLLRDVAAEELVAALRAVAAGLVVLDPVLAGMVLPAQEPHSGLLVEELTPRELEVLQLLAEGLSNKAIAMRLEISEHTVKFHVNAILGKMGAQSRTEAVVRATRLGLLIL
jgi:two-component system nitrate/nitrite response regulator NarL